MSQSGTYPPIRPPNTSGAPTTQIFSGGTVSGGVSSHDQLSNVRFDQHAHSIQSVAHTDIIANIPADGWVLTAHVDGTSGAVSYTFQAPAGVGGASGTDPFPQYAFAQHGHQYDDLQGLPYSPEWAYLPTGAKAETFSRAKAGVDATTASVSGTVYLIGIGLMAGVLCTSVTFVSGATAIGTPTHQIFGLYDSSRNLLRSTADDGATAWGTNAAKTLTLTSTFTTTYTGLHYLGFLVTTSAGGLPSLWSVSANATPVGLAPILFGSANTGQTTLPTPASALTAKTNIPYGYLS